MTKKTIENVVVPEGIAGFKCDVFPTGSLVYGEPGADSDCDLVIRMRRDLADWLVKAIPGAVQTENLNDKRHTTVFLIGRLNLICTHTDLAHLAWQCATRVCYEARFLTRDQAKKIHSRLRKDLGVSAQY